MVQRDVPTRGPTTKRAHRGGCASLGAPKGDTSLQLSSTRGNQRSGASSSHRRRFNAFTVMFSLLPLTEQGEDGFSFKPGNFGAPSSRERNESGKRRTRIIKETNCSAPITYGTIKETNGDVAAAAEPSPPPTATADGPCAPNASFQLLKNPEELIFSLEKKKNLI